MITAACFEHSPIIGSTAERIAAFEHALLAEVENHSSCVFAHVVLPNHYHILVESSDIAELRNILGRFHGRTSYQWNKEESTAGRKIFHGSAETVMKSERHFQATLNYIHHNPVKHGYAKKWQDWPFSSAATYLATIGELESREHWLEYPIDRYGEEWDT